MARKLFLIGATLAAALAIVAVAVSGPGARKTEAAQVSWTVPLIGAQEVPAADGGFGSALVTYDNSTRQMTITINAITTSGPIIAGHIHRGAVGVAGPVIIPFNLPPNGGGPMSVVVGVTLSAADATDLLAGNLYLNLHTTGFPGGFARGQLIVPAGAFPAAPAPTTAAAPAAAAPAAPALTAPKTGDAGLADSRSGGSAYMVLGALALLLGAGGVVAARRRS